MDKLLYEGICFGGPIHGEVAISRFPKGFLLVDKPANQLWIYEWDSASGTFSVRQNDPMEVYLEGPKNRFRAAEESNYDVIAAHWVRWQ